MRLARVHLADTAAPRVAIELDGCLYDVAELEERWGSALGAAPASGGADWFTRVVALRCEGLDELEDHLARGRRPTEARVHESELLWLPPCDDARQAFVQLARGDARAPWCVGLARSFVGPDAVAWMPARERRAEVRVDVAVTLGDDLVRASPAEAARAILGCTPMLDWRPLDTDAPCERHLGPALVVGPPDPTGARARLRVDERTVFEGALGLDLTAAAARISRLSRTLPLRAGDILAVGLDAAVAVLPIGARVELTIESLGRLRGRVGRARD